MKILITSPSLDPAKNVSGISSVVSTIIQNGNNTYLHYSLGSTDKDKGKKDLKWVSRMFSTFGNYNAFLKKNNPELVHMNIPCDTKGIIREYIIFLINKKHKKPVVAHLHGGEYLMSEPKNKLIKYFLKRILFGSNKVIVLSEIEKGSLDTLYGYNKANVLYNSVDTTMPYKVFNKKQDGLITILFLGRIHESKGVDDIAEAFRKLYPERKFRFVVCGAGPKEAFIKEQCSSFMKENFEYRGIVSGEKKINTIIESDIFILPSRYGEGLPVSLLEAMAAGVVPVVTNDASMKFVITDNENGIFVEKESPEDIYLKLKDILVDYDKMRLLSINARKTMEHQFDVRKMIEKLERYYNESMLQ